MKPTPIKPRIIIAQVDGSGTGVTMAVEFALPCPVAVMVYLTVTE